VYGQDWLNMMQEENMSILSAAGITESKTTYDQVLQSLNILFGQLGAANSWAATQTFGPPSTAAGSAVVNGYNRAAFGATDAALTVNQGAYQQIGMQINGSQGGHSLIFTNSIYVDDVTPTTYFDGEGAMHSRLYAVISGVTNPTTGSGSSIIPASSGATMFSIWADVDSAAMEIRTSPLDAGPDVRYVDYLGGAYPGGGSNGGQIYELSILPTGKLSWGASSLAAQDTNLYRASAGVLQTDGTFAAASISTGTILNTGTLTLPTSTDTLVGRATTDTLTNKTFDTAGTGNSFLVSGTAITAKTGTGSTVALSAGPTFTGTLHGASGSFTGTLSSNGILNSNVEIRLGNASYSRVATADGGGSWGGGYNFNVNGGGPLYDSNGSTAGFYFYNAGSIRFFAGGTSTAGSSAPQVALFHPTGASFMTTTVNGAVTVGGDIMPEADGTRNLGSATYEFATAYLTGLALNANHLNVSTSKTPSSSSAAGTAGDIAWDSSYIYVCVATNTWKRTAISTW
jgi:hypothetical protein